MGWAKVMIRISIANEQKKRWVWAEVKIWNHVMIHMKRGRKIMGFGWSKHLDFNSKLAEKRWVWAEVKIWNQMILYMRRGRKIMGLKWRKHLDLLIFYKGKVQKNHGFSQSKDLLMFAWKLAEKSWVEPK